MLGNKRINSGAMIAQGLSRARLVEPHQPAVANDVGSKYGGKSAGGRGHGCGRPPWGRGVRLNFTTTRASRQAPHGSGRELAQLGGFGDLRVVSKIRAPAPSRRRSN